MNTPEAYQTLFGNLPINCLTDDTNSPKTEKAKDVTKRSFTKFIGSKFEKGEIARLVVGPTNKSIVPIRLEIDALVITKWYLKFGE